MKKIKSLKLMLLGLLAFGSSNAFAQALDSEIEKGNYVYKVTKESKLVNGVMTTGTVEMLRLTTTGTTVNGDNLIFPGNFEYTVGNTTYKYNVTTMDKDVFRNNSYDAKHAVIPKELTEIPTGAFNTLTNLFDLTFQEGSQVTKIMPQAFASTQISSFDFSPCTKLEGLMDGVFVQEGLDAQGKPNKNANITTITLPTSTAFKHINAALSNLKALTTINNLENSWIRELVDGAFYGCDKLWKLELPGNDLQYISSKALEGSAIEELKVNVGSGVTNGNPLKYLGGCTVAYKFREATQDYVYNYEGAAYTVAGGNVEWAPAEATTNIYGLTEPGTDVPVAPLRKLTITGTLQGKICTNAFAWCDHLANTADGHATTNVPTPALVVSGLNFGSKAQIETHAFYHCDGIATLTLNDINDNKLDAGEYTIEAAAFESCPIATLTLGNIMTNNAIGSAAFGNSLKTVKIGTVKAASSAFQAAEDAVAATTAVYAFTSWNAATEGTQYASGTVEVTIPESGDIYTVEVLENTVEGFVGSTYYINNAEEGARKKLYSDAACATQVGDIYIAIGEKQSDNAAAAVKGAFIWADVSGATLELATENGQFVSSDNPDAIDADNNPIVIIPKGTFDFEAVVNKAGAANFVYPVVTIGEIKSQGGVFAESAILGQNVDKLHFTGDINTNGLDVAILKGYVLNNKPANLLSELTFAGAIKTNGIGTGAFCNFTNLKKLSFAGLLSKEAVASHSFTNTGLVGPDGNIGTKDEPFVTYTADLSANDASENPFASDAFDDLVVVDPQQQLQPVQPVAGDIQTEPKHADRIIYWSVSNSTLSASILAAIQKDVLGDEYDGEVVNPKFNVYKWIAYLVKEEESLGFIVFTDNKQIALDQNTDPTLAWGRYDLGSFAAEGNVADQNLSATDMIIDRYQTVKGVGGDKAYDVKVTLYGMYWDQDDKGKKSEVYMVPLEVINGQYWIPCDNKHLIIAKVKNIGETNTQFEEDQILLGYTKGDYPKAATYAFKSFDAAQDGNQWAKGEVKFVDQVQVGNEDYSILEVTKQETPTGFVGKQFAVKATEVPVGDVRLQLYEVTAEGQIGDAIQNMWVEIEELTNGTESTLTASSVWDQLQEETAGVGPVLDANAVAPKTSVERVFKKADHSWTNEELVDAVKHEGGSQNIANKDLHVLLDPSKNAGFDVKRLIVERKTDGTGAFIGINWYFALLNNYQAPSNQARVIWLDYDQATAIFGVKNNVEAAGINDGAIYNLQGIRVNKASKGVYIMNGKKYVVK